MQISNENQEIIEHASSLAYGNPAESFLYYLKQHVDEGVPVSELGAPPAAKRRIIMYMQIWERLQTDPNVNLRMLLKREYKRTYSEMARDLKVLAVLVSKLNASDRTLDEFRVRANADRMIRIGEATGDWKAIEAGTKTLERVAKLDKDPVNEEERGPRRMPMVITTNVEDVNAQRKSYTKEELDRMAEAKGAVRDPMMDYVEREDGEYVSIEDMKAENKRLRALAKYMSKAELAASKQSMDEEQTADDVQTEEEEDDE